MVTANENPLFDQPSTPGITYPDRLLNDFSTGPFDLRYTYIEQDDDTLVILGHPEIERIATLCKAIGFSPPPVGVRTWGRMLTGCPDHTAKNDDCMKCHHATPENWWLDWGPITETQANANKPGYFPITVLIW